MFPAALPTNEPDRLAALLAYDILDTDAEQAYDDLTQIASAICGAPIALVSLVDEERQWFKSRVGLEARETPRDVAFCSHAILEPEEVLVVPDSLEDERFCDNPLAIGDPHVRFYAGAPLVNREGLALGTLCVIDHAPRQLTSDQLETLRALSRQVVSQLELRKTLKELQESTVQIRRANADLQRFTAVAAHDLQAPVRKLTAFTGLLKEDLGDDLPPDAEDDLKYIVAAAERMDRLVAALLDLSRTGACTLKEERFPLKDCVEYALDALAPRIEEHGASVSVDPLPLVKGDPTLLTQVFQNLIGNALKFTRSESPSIHVTCESGKGRHTFGVKDDGIGMDPKFATEIFTPFRRLHASCDYEGLGIGLAIVYKIIERHGGRIWVESSPGRGSHFRFKLNGTS